MTVVPRCAVGGPQAATVFSHVLIERPAHHYKHALYVCASPHALCVLPCLGPTRLHRSGVKHNNLVSWYGIIYICDCHGTKRCGMLIMCVCAYIYIYHTR